MSKPGKQFSLVGGVGSGAGALAVGTAVDQTGNLLGILATVHTPNVKVGVPVNNFGGRKVRFGAVSSTGGHAFDYPDLAVKNPQGNGQSYRSSKAGYTVGNNGAGQAGYGTTREFDRTTMVSGDLTDAYRVADYMEMNALPEHMRTWNKSEETLREHFEEQKKEHELEKVSHLMAMGFTEEEIKRKTDKEREKAIDQASKMDRTSATLERAIRNAGPTTDIGLSVAPGLMPNRINADSYQRAVGAGTLVTKGKAAQAMRRREAMALKIDAQEPVVKTPMAHSQIIQQIMGLATKEEHKRQEHTMVAEEKMIQHKKLAEQARMARHFAMQKALEKK
jgi:hypothetical protein